MAKKFKKGDRVKMANRVFSSAPEVGSQGTVRSIRAGEYLVEFDRKFPAGHAGLSSDNPGKDGHCWWAQERELEAIFDEKIIIYRDGDRVFAKDINTGKTAKAICSEDDEFDFGARLALERLTKKEPEPEGLLNCRFVVTKIPDKCTVTVGRIYEVKEGQFRTDDNWCAPIHSRLHSIDELKDYMEHIGKSNRRFHWKPVSITPILEN